MNFILDTLVKNLSDSDYEYLSLEFSDDLVELVKETGLYPDKYMKSFENFSEDKLPDRREFHSFLKGGSINKSDGSISEKDEWISEKTTYQWKRLFACCQYLEWI